MNILWMYFRPLNPETGGTERITQLISNGLSHRGHTCHGMLVFSKELKTISYNKETINDLLSFLNKKEIDVVINQMGHSTWLLKNFLNAGGKNWQERGGKIITCLHFDPHPLSDAHFYNSLLETNWRIRLAIFKCSVFALYYSNKRKSEARKVFRYTYNNSDFFIVLSPLHIPYIKKVMTKKECPQLVAINNPLTFEDISSSSIVKTKKKLVITVCRMSEYDKRVSLILKAWKIIKLSEVAKDWTLKMIGDGPDLMKYCQIAYKMNLKDYSFEGQQSPGPYYQEASIFLMTSAKEGWGLTITESLQRGVVPVVMDSSDVFHDILIDGENGFLTQENDINGFSGKVIQLMQDEGMRHSMALNGLKSAERFTLDKTIDKWEELLNKLDRDTNKLE